MPSRVGRVGAWSRLVNRFLLEPIHPLVMKTIGDQVVPVTQFDDLLRTPQGVRVGSIDLQASAGTFVAFFTVPEGERWTLKQLHRPGTTANSLVALQDGSGSYIPLTTLGTTEAIFGSAGIELDQGWQIGMLTTGNAGDSSRDLRIYYLLEDAFI